MRRRKDIFTAACYKDAKIFAARAQQRLKRGSPGWVRAQDIINFKVAKEEVNLSPGGGDESMIATEGQRQKVNRFSDKIMGEAMAGSATTEDGERNRT